MPLRVSLVSAEAEVWSGEADLVVAKSIEGEIGFIEWYTFSTLFPVYGTTFKNAARPLTKQIRFIKERPY